MSLSKSILIVFFAPMRSMGTSEDESVVYGFLCESDYLIGAKEITQYGGWRGYLEVK
jgi:hypothetical protein